MSLVTRERLAHRKKEYKKGIDRDDARRKRDDLALQIRKQKREEKMAKRRRSVVNPSVVNPTVVNPKLSQQPLSNQSSQRTPIGKNLIDTDLINQIYSEDPNAVLEGLTYIRTLLSCENPDISTIVQMGNLIPKTVEFLTYAHYPKHQLEAAWIMTNAISENSRDARRILDNTPLLQYAIRLLGSQDATLRDQIVWCIGNIAGEGDKYRIILLENNVVLRILNCLESEWKNSKRDLKKLRNLAWTLSNLIRPKPYPSISSMYQCLPILVKIVHNSNDPELLMDACWSLSYISSALKDDDMDTFLQFKPVTTETLKLLESKDGLVTPILRICGNLIAGTNKASQTILDLGFLDYVPMLLFRCQSIKKETCWILSNVAAGTKSQAYQLVQMNLVPVIMIVLYSETWEVKKECIYILANLATRESHKLTKHLVSKGCIRGLCESLGAEMPPEIISLILEAFLSILKSGSKHGKEIEYANQIEEEGGLDKIENLQYHQNENIYNQSVEILEKYFAAEEETLDDYDPLSFFDSTLRVINDLPDFSF